MKIEYVCHACVVVDTGDVKIATDPWYYGPAYCNQWHVFPKPVNANLLDTADVILVSHGHEDHLHDATLRRLPKASTAFYPYMWASGVRPYLQSIGFAGVTEAAHLRTYHLTADTTITYLVSNLDSIMVIENRGEVFVNINDALHSAPAPIVDAFVQELKKRWPRIDTVFCGFGGASYFPNTIHCEGKADVEVAEVREELFARNFCRIVKELNPAVAVPFAADFALLQPHQMWINEARFPRARLAGYFQDLYPDACGAPEIIAMYSGDVLDGNRLICKSPYRDQMGYGGVNALVRQQYGDEIAALEKEDFITEDSAELLTSEIAGNVAMRSSLFSKTTLERVRFTVTATDVEERPCFNIGFRAGKATVERSSDPDGTSILVLATSSRILLYSFASDWGGDAITIGYGCDIRVFDQKTIVSNLDTICVRLLTRHPSIWSKVEPVRWMRQVWNSPVALDGYRSSLNTLNVVTREMLFRPKCEVCRACDYLFGDQKPPSSVVKERARAVAGA